MANQVPTGTTQPSSSSDLAPKEALNGNAYPTVSATLQGKGQDCAVPTMSPVTTMATTSASRSPSSSPLSSAVDVRFPPTSQHGSKVTLEEELTSSMHQNHGSASNLSMSAFPRNPLSPMSAPHLASGPGWSFSAPNSTTTTPTPSSVPTVPTIIHTQSGAARSGPTPYFPFAMPESASYPKLHNNSASGGGKSVQVNAKKKHNIKASTSSTSLHSADGTTSSASNSVSGGGGGGGEVTVRRQKRLERNRESARLSRRRRKQYLEILEEKVNRLSLETDQGRRQHARRAVDQILQLRSQVLQDAEVMMEQGGSADNNNNNNSHDEHYLHQAAARLDGPLSRANNEFQVLSTFWTQQLKSFSLPADTKAILWLTLQGDAFFRGGRSASERLSAARIGERMLNSGNDKAPPAHSMWPLVCNEVGLSYEQEERLRTYQRTLVLPDANTWLDRHTARASGLVMQSLHDGVGSMISTLSRREQSTTSVLTPAQRIKFLSWAEKNANRIQARMDAKRRQYVVDLYQVPAPVDAMDVATSEATYRLNRAQHLAVNLYILNHRLQQTVLKDFPYHCLHEVTEAALKKLSRRPSFESLGQQKDADGRLLKRDDSFASSGSLSMMNSASTPSLQGIEEQAASQHQQAVYLTPEEGQETAAATIEHVLGPIKEIIPPILPPVATEFSAAHSPTPFPAPLSAAYASAPALDHYHHGYGYSFELPQQVPRPFVQSSGPQVAVAPAPVTTSAAFAIAHQHYQPNSTPEATYEMPHLTHVSYEPSCQPQQQQLQGVEYYQQEQQQQHAPATYASQPIAAAASPASFVPPATASDPTQPQMEQPLSIHVRRSSFLPPHLNVVPEDMFPMGDAVEDDFFVGLMEDDWAIGGGIDMDTTG